MMWRVVGAGCVLACVLALPALVQASTRGSATGTVVTIDGSSVTIQTPGRRVRAINALSGAATHVTGQDYPYVYGGGHDQAGTASIGIPGPGYNGHRIGYDCSGAVAAVLSAAGLWPAGSGVPNDAGIVAQLRQQGLIVPGVGSGPVQVTLWDDPGIHIFMNIDGRFFGTSDGGGGGNRHGGAGWLDDGAPDTGSRRYHPYHFLPSVLRGSASTGHMVTFEIPSSLSGQVQLGDKVKIAYSETRSGSLVATAIKFPGSLTATGTVVPLAGTGAFTIQPAQGPALTFTVVDGSDLAQGLETGETVEVSYTKHHGVLTARSVLVTAQPAPSG